MPSIVTVGTFDSEDVDGVTKVLREFDDTVTPQVTRLRRRQFFRYCDLYVHVQDWDAAWPEAHRTVTTDPRFRQLDESLSAHFGEYTAPVDWDGPTDRPTASRFYLWPAEHVDDLERTHCTVVVNTQRQEHIPEVSRLFAELDATDFPQTMGTLRRQLFLYRGVYLHIQDFAEPDGRGVIDNAFKEADPRFIKICNDLTPIVPPYNAEAGGVATRFYHWAAEQEVSHVQHGS